MVRFCVGSSFVAVTLTIARGESVTTLLRTVLQQLGCRASLLGTLFVAVRQLFEEAAPTEAEAGSLARQWQDEARLQTSPDEELRRALGVLVATVGRGHLLQLEGEFRAARRETCGDRDTQLRILEDSHSLTMAQVAARGDEPREELLADQRLQLAILEGKYVRELAEQAEQQRAHFGEYVRRFASIAEATPLSQRLAAATATRVDAEQEVAEVEQEKDYGRNVWTSFVVLARTGHVLKVSCVAENAADLARTADDWCGEFGALVVVGEAQGGAQDERALCEEAERAPELLHDQCGQQLRERRTRPVREGDVLVTRHSSMGGLQLVLHVVLPPAALLDATTPLAAARATTRLLLLALRQAHAACAVVGAHSVAVPLTWLAQDEEAGLERAAAVVQLAREYASSFRHLRLYVSPKATGGAIPDLTRLVRSLKSGWS